MSAQQQRWARRGRPSRIWLAALFALGLSITTLISHWQARSARAPDRHSVAQQLLRDGQSNQAAYLFVDPSWRAVAHYRAGNYQRAIDSAMADGVDTAFSLYNSASAYAHLGQYERGIEVLERLLAVQPDHADARHNLDILRALNRPPTDATGEGSQGRQSGGANSQAPGAAQTNEPDHENPSPGDRAVENLQVVKQEPEQPQMMQAAIESDSQGEGLGAQTEGGGGSEPADSGDNNTGGGRELGDKSVLGRAPGEDALLAVRDSENSPGSSDAAPRPIARQPEDEKAMADEILLRHIVDDAAVVLRARFRASLGRAVATAGDD